MLSPCVARFKSSTIKSSRLPSLGLKPANLKRPKATPVCYIFQLFFRRYWLSTSHKFAGATIYFTAFLNTKRFARDRKMVPTISPGERAGLKQDRSLHYQMRFHRKNRELVADQGMVALGRITVSPHKSAASPFRPRFRLHVIGKQLPAPHPCTIRLTCMDRREIALCGSTA